jgi:hypothetical protein
MVINTINYCRTAGIDTVLDGSNNYDAHALEQHACVKDLFTELYKKKGIEFISPCYYEKDIVVSGKTLDVIRRHLSVYKDSTEKRTAYLKSRGIDLGRGVGSQYRATQPSCVVSVLFNAPRVILKLIKNEKPENYLAYIRDRYAGYADTVRASKQG